MWSSFCWGLVVGFALAWLWDFFYWRRRVDSVANTSYKSAASDALSGGATAASAPFVTTAVATPMAMAARFRDDDIEAIEGIGPKIAELLRGSGIASFAAIAATPMDKLVAILDAAGPRFRLANPGTWVEQAALAAKGDWDGFDKLKTELVAGVRLTPDVLTVPDAPNAPTHKT